MPYALWVGVICEAFTCRPSEAEAELERCPPGWIEEVLEARQYAEAFEMIRRAKDPTTVPASPMVDLVRLIDAELAVDRYHEKRRAKTHG